MAFKEHSLAPPSNTANNAHKFLHRASPSSDHLSLDSTSDEYSAVANNRQISDRVTRKELAELSIARLKVSSLE